MNAVTLIPCNRSTLTDLMSASVVQAVCERYALRAEKLTSPSRNSGHVLARTVAMIALAGFGLSYPRIGAALNRTSWTVRASIDKIHAGAGLGDHLKREAAIIRETVLARFQPSKPQMEKRYVQQ